MKLIKIQNSRDITLIKTKKILMKKNFINLFLNPKLNLTEIKN